MATCVTPGRSGGLLTVSLLAATTAAPARADVWDDNDYLLVNGPRLFVLHEDFTYKTSVQLSNQTPFPILFWGSLDWLPNGDVMVAGRGYTSSIARLTPDGQLTTVTLDFGTFYWLHDRSRSLPGPSLTSPSDSHFGSAAAPGPMG